jgi:hypothetical protein
MIGANVPHANIVSHDKKDIGFLVLRLGRSSRAEKRSSGDKQPQAIRDYVSFHFELLSHLVLDVLRDVKLAMLTHEVSAALLI